MECLTEMGREEYMYLLQMKLTGKADRIRALYATVYHTRQRRRESFFLLSSAVMLSCALRIVPYTHSQVRAWKRSAHSVGRHGLGDLSYRFNEPP